MIARRAERFEELRPVLVRHAYRMLGEYEEAEDVAQDAYLRWNAVLERERVQDDRALALLTEDVVFTSGGGKVPAAIAPVAGRDRVSRLLFGLREKGWRDIVRIDLVTLNGMPGMITHNASGVQEVVAFEVAGGRIAAMYVVRNPEKLKGVARHPSTSSG